MRPSQPLITLITGLCSKGATTVLKFGVRAPKARVEAPKAPREVECLEGCYPLPLGARGRGPCPLSRNVFDFLSENGEFWCILGGASALYVATAQESEA